MASEHTSIAALSYKTRQILSKLLNPWTVCSSETGLPQNWRGLLQCCNVPDQFSASFHSSNDPTNDILLCWQAHDPTNSTVQNLLRILEHMDRFDVIDDTKEAIGHDLQNYSHRVCIRSPDLSIDHNIRTVDDQRRYARGLGPQIYNAYILCADEQEDENFAMEVVTKMENEHNMKLCIGCRDLLPGVLEDEAVISLIIERSDRLILILSPSFFQSRVNMYVTNVTQAYNLRKDVGRKLLPVVYKKCDMPATLLSFHPLNYERWLRNPSLYDFWEKLKGSIVLHKKSSVVQVTNDSVAENSFQAVPENNISTVTESNAPSVAGCDRSTLADASEKLSVAERVLIVEQNCDTSKAPQKSKQEQIVDFLKRLTPRVGRNSKGAEEKEEEKKMKKLRKQVKKKVAEV